ncbi:hypothetical protein FHR71_001139 [Methylobacterium sp. RAS18]|nr:hypothetical protein [Methylobacterium sp. RAS18]
MGALLSQAGALIANGWTAYSFAATLAGGAGLGLVVLALVATAWLPGFIRRPLLAAGIALMVGAALYQAGQAKGAHDAFALQSARAMAAEIKRTEAAETVAARIAAQAAQDLAAEQAARQKLQELNDVLRTDPHRDRECLPRDLSRRLRDL